MPSPTRSLFVAAALAWFSIAGCGVDTMSAAVKAIAACNAELGSHLDASVRTGIFCCYAPAAEVRWRVTEDTAR